MNTVEKLRLYRGTRGSSSGGGGGERKCSVHILIKRSGKVGAGEILLWLAQCLLGCSCLSAWGYLQRGGGGGGREGAEGGQIRVKITSGYWCKKGGQLLRNTAFVGPRRSGGREEKKQEVEVGQSIQGACEGGKST